MTKCAVSYCWKENQGGEIWCWDHSWKRKNLDRALSAEKRRAQKKESKPKKETPMTVIIDNPLSHIDYAKAEQTISAFACAMRREQDEYVCHVCQCRGPADEGAPMCYFKKNGRR